MSPRPRFAVLAATLFGLAPLLGRPADAPGAASPLTLGLLLPPSETEAVGIRLGAELGVEAANREPGARLKLIVRGSAGQWGTDGDDAVVLALDQGAQALIAPTSGAAVHQALQVAGRTRVPVVSLCGDSSVTGAGIPWTVRIAPSTEQEAAALFAAWAPTAPPLRVAAFVPPERAGREARADLRSAARNMAVEIVNFLELPGRDPDFAALARQAMAQRPDAALLWVESAPASRLAGALRAAGFNGRLAGPSRLASKAFFQPAGRSAEGFLLTAPVPEANASALRDRFLEDYRARVEARADGAEPTPDFAAALAFDSVQLLAEVLRRTGGQPAFRAFPLTRIVPGVTGELAFDRSGNRRLQLQVLEWRDGCCRPFVPADQR